MTPLRLLPLLGALVAINAQSDDSGTSSSSAKVWATVAYINHGEKTPDIGGLQVILTPKGAQQMLKQGTAFRNRYLASSSGNSTTANATIQGVSPDSIDNDALTIFSRSDEWVSASAAAFFQGLYPPNPKAINQHAGGDDLAQDLITDANATSYPLNGYQYPNIITLSAGNSDSAAVDGTSGCSAWQSQVNTNLTTDNDLSAKAQKSRDFYQKLFTTDPLAGTVPLDQAIYWNAYDIYEFVNYQYTHNKTVHGGLKDANTTLATLETNALEVERAKAGTAAGTDDDPGAVVHSIAGRTLASKVAYQLLNFVNGTDSSAKMSFLFGSHEPLMSFFGVSGLLTRENVLSTPIGNLTRPGAAIVFDLIGDNESEPNNMPTQENLSVRFSYRASADEDEEFQAYSLFDSGFDGQTIPYTAFLEQIDQRGRNAIEWCDICRPMESVTWCSSVSIGDRDHAKTGSPMSPAVSGIIGAVIMTGIVGILGLALFTLGGLHFGRRPSPDSSSSAGGFKRNEKMASDPDLRMNKGGAPQERIGSWEMSDGSYVEQQPRSLGTATSNFHRNHRREGHAEDDDEISILGASPMNMRESV